MTASGAFRPPRVGVVIAAHDAERFLAATLDSALAQSSRDLEIVVVDDGSTDATGELVEARAAADPRLRLVRQANRGVSAARNRGIAETRGELVAILDHDDLWHAEKLAAQLRRLDERPGAGVVTCFSAVIDERHRTTGWRIGDPAEGDVYRRMLGRDLVAGGSVPLVRRAALARVGGFDESLAVREDWDLWIRLARHVPFTTVGRALVGYTRRPGGASRDRERMIEEGRRVLARARRDDPSIGAARLRHLEARDLFAMAGFCLLDEQSGTAWRLLSRSLARSPSPLLVSPRRWAVVALLAAASALPRRAYRALLARVARRAFAIAPGRPFATSAEPAG